MPNDEGISKDDPVDAGIASMFSLILSALTHNWSALASLSAFPRAGGETGGTTDGEVVGADILNMQMRAITSGWQMFGEAMQGTIDAALGGQDTAAQQISRTVAGTFRSFTGLDHDAIMAAVERDWSPKQVALRTFGLGDSDVLATSIEMVQLATASGKTVRATVNLYRIVSDAWIRAARAFSDSYSGQRSDPADLAKLQRAWAATVEPMLQDTLRSEGFVKAHAEFLRAASRQAKIRSSLAKRFTDFIEAPHRQEMNETYEALQELRREIRALKQNQRRLENALAASVAPEPARDGERGRKGG